MLKVRNYAYWKAWMNEYIKPIDEKVWPTMLTSWEPPKRDIENGRVVKPKVQWTTNEEKLANANNKPLYVISYGVYLQEFKRLAKCIVDKSAWDLLETTHEGTTIVKQLKRQMVTLRFENMRM